jgi:hypothetical protein
MENETDRPTNLNYIKQVQANQSLADGINQSSTCGIFQLLMIIADICEGSIMLSTSALASCDEFSSVQVTG